MSWSSCSEVIPPVGLQQLGSLLLRARHCCSTPQNHQLCFGYTLGTLVATLSAYTHHGNVPVCVGCQGFDYSCDVLLFQECVDIFYSPPIALTQMGIDDKHPSPSFSNSSHDRGISGSHSWSPLRSSTQRKTNGQWCHLRETNSSQTKSQE